MNADSSWAQLVDLFEIIVKFMGRATVQRQLVALVLVAVVAWAVNWAFLRWIDRRAAQAAAKEGGDDEVSDVAEQLEAAEHGEDYDVELPEPPPPSNWERLRHAVVAIARNLTLALLALALAQGVFWFFQSQGWFAGLIRIAVQLLWWFLVYRTLLGILYAVFDEDMIAHHHRRFFTPLFVVLVFLAILSQLTSPAALSDSLVLPQFLGTMTLGAVFIATVGFYLWIALTELLKDVLQAVVNARRTENIGATQATLTLWRYGFIALGLVVVLRVLGLDPTTVAAITGGLSIGVGLALQDVLKNFLGGIILLFEGTVRPGDWVEISGTEGAVDKLSIRSTVVRTFDNVEYIVPNQDWLNSTVTTYTRNSRRTRARVPIGVSYDSDVRQVQEILLGLARSHPDVLQDPPPLAPLIGFGDSSVDFVVLAWVEDALIKGKVAGELRLMIWDAFKEHGIEIPYPQRDLHLRSGLPVGLPESTPDHLSDNQANGENGRTRAESAQD